MCLAIVLKCSRLNLLIIICQFMQRFFIFQIGKIKKTYNLKKNV